MAAAPSKKAKLRRGKKVQTLFTVLYPMFTWNRTSSSSLAKFNRSILLEFTACIYTCHSPVKPEHLWPQKRSGVACAQRAVYLGENRKRVGNAGLLLSAGGQPNRLAVASSGRFRRRCVLTALIGDHFHRGKSATCCE